MMLALVVETLQAATFAIHVVDDATGRGVPLVELTTVNGIGYITDSAGYVAFDEPGLLGGRVYFSIKSHGYEYPKDGFGMRGIALDPSSGGQAELKIKRINIAERLYRITGQGIYADSVRLGKKVPLKQPLLSGRVLGQDSAQAQIYRDQVHWFWGDTNQAAYPLGLFKTSGAVSQLPDKGGLEPSVGVDLTYFTDKQGFSRAMAPVAGEGPVWIDGLLTVKDAAGQQRMVCRYSRMKDLATKLEQGFLVYNDEQEVLEIAKEAKLPLSEKWRFPLGQATLVSSEQGDYWYFVNPYATTRVAARLESVLDPAQYEAYTALMSPEGKLAFEWTKTGPPLDQKQEANLIKQGKLAPDEGRLQIRDAASGKAVMMHTGSIRWNAYRQKFILIGVEIGGGPSHLGEVWYAEAARIDGPWRNAVKIATHDRYTFYNPVQHDFFDREGGRKVYFEGSYTHTFSGNKVATPRYDYNQIMYELDLADERLKPAQ